MESDEGNQDLDLGTHPHILHVAALVPGSACRIHMHQLYIHAYMHTFDEAMASRRGNESNHSLTRAQQLQTQIDSRGSPVSG